MHVVRQLRNFDSEVDTDGVGVLTNNTDALTNGMDGLDLVNDKGKLSSDVDTDANPNDDFDDDDWSVWRRQTT
jgi:hypothetical protein